MERQITDLEYSNTDATVEQVKAAIRSDAERYTKDNYWRYNEHITEFREIKTDTGKQEGES